jgi:flavin-dependent dehydrogenase
MNGSARVVIIGGVYAGTVAAKLLDGEFDVTVIERKETFFHNVAALRAAAKGGEWDFDPEAPEKRPVGRPFRHGKRFDLKDPET